MKYPGPTNNVYNCIKIINKKISELKNSIFNWDPHMIKIKAHLQGKNMIGKV